MSAIPAQWTPDCQGKWDFDGVLVCLSTRYWPAGGGFMVLSDGTMYDGVDGIRPSASAKLVLGNIADEFYDDAVTLCEQDFEGDTEAEVKAAVEAWASEQWRRVQTALLREFGEVAK